MGIAFSCPFDDLDDFEGALMKSIDFEGDDMTKALHSVGSNGRDSGHTITRSFSSAKMVFEGSLSFNGRQLSTTFSFNSTDSEQEKIQPEGDQLTGSDGLSKIQHALPTPESGKQLHEAALKLQKVYKSFRTRRQLADCAVVVEQRWWKLLDFAELKRSSISFFDIEKPETAISRWSRARTRAAKVGKGLSKDEKARKLALQHWLEAIDPRHRYGHNLQFYYCKWLHCQSRQPFFYWLDIGEGKEVNLDVCPRSKLQQQCIKYLGPSEREIYEVVFKDGKFVYKQSGELLDTTGGPEDTKWIFVLSAAKTLYVGRKKKGKFQHSSFLAGGATLSAGRLVVEDGVLKAVWPHSGHYLPTEENFQEFMSFLREHNVDLTNVKENPTEEEEEAMSEKVKSNSFRSDQLDASRTSTTSLSPESTDLRQQDSDSAEKAKPFRPKLARGLGLNISRLEIPGRGNMQEILKDELPRERYFNVPANEDGYESGEDSDLTEEDFMLMKINLFDEDEEKENEEPIPQEKIVERINSHKGMKSYQLAKQLSSKWTTGAGPRIGCMRDYPSELQSWVLEQANLSPRMDGASSTPWSSRFSQSTPTSIHREVISRIHLAQ